MGLKVGPILSAKASAPPTAVWPVQGGMLCRMAGSVNAPPFCAAVNDTGPVAEWVCSALECASLKPQMVNHRPPRTARTLLVPFLSKASMRPLRKFTCHANDELMAAGVDDQ